MTEYFLRDDMAAGTGPAAGDPDALLRWGYGLAERAAPEDVYRNKEGRKTLRFWHRDQPFFLKQHAGIGWGEIVKNLLQARLPVLGAKNEYQAVNALRRLGVDTMSVAAYTSRGWNPAAIQSMIVTDDLVGTVSLEDYCADWASQAPAFTTRLRILLKLADSSRRMHGAGINHRDYYLCHFHLDESTLDSSQLRCHLIDLHRAQLRRRVPRRWQVKDLAGLYFSAMDCGLTRRDLLRFMHHYHEGGLREALRQNAALWAQVEKRAQQLYRKDHGREPPPLVGEGH
jgi:heptose I phosphotransferase